MEKKSLFSKAKGKLNLIVHYISSASLIDSILGVDPAQLSPNAPELPAQQSQVNKPVRTNSVSSQLNNEQNSEANNDPLPQGWEQRCDQNGRIYYVDHISKTTTWIRPTPRNANVSPNLNSSNSSTNDSEANTGALNATNNQARRSSVTNNSSGQNAQMVRRHFNDDNASSQTNLANDTSESDANPPQPSSQSATQPTNTTNSPTSGVVVQENGVRTSPDEPPLPPGWDFSRSDKGRIFFIDHVNKQTTWIDPRTGKPSPQPDYKGNIIGPLPAGWEERRHVDGRIFYIDHSLLILF